MAGSAQRLDGDRPYADRDQHEAQRPDEIDERRILMAEEIGQDGREDPDGDGRGDADRHRRGKDAFHPLAGMMEAAWLALAVPG